MKTLFNFIFVLFTLVGLLSCGTTDPPLPPDTITTLEYDWKIDTLLNPHGYGVVPWSMWGSSPTDVWTVGFNLAGQGEMFHYNGTKWNRVTPDLGFNYELAAIFGFSENEVFAVGSKLIVDTMLHSESLVLKYNGVSWQRENMSSGSGLLFINGQNTNDVWACGYYGTLYHKQGNVWLKIPFNEKYDLGPIWVSPYDNVYMMYDYDDYTITQDTTMFYFSKLENNIWQILDSCRLVSVNGIRTGYKFGEKGMVGISANEIYSTGTGIFKYNGDIWKSEAWDDYGHRDIKTTEKGIIFSVGDHGTIRYLLNNQWKRISDYNRYVVDFYSVMPFENEIFIGAYSAGNGYIIHGTLKK